MTLNARQQHRSEQLVVQSPLVALTRKCLAVLGFAFKDETNDTGKAPVICSCRDLLEEGDQLAIRDPKVQSAQMAWDLMQ